MMVVIDRLQRTCAAHRKVTGVLLLIAGMTACRTTDGTSTARSRQESRNSPALEKALALVAKPDLSATEVATFSTLLAQITSSAELQTAFEQVIFAVDNQAQIGLARALKARKAGIGQESTDYTAIAGDAKSGAKFQESLACTVAQAAIEPYLAGLDDRRAFETDVLHQGIFYREPMELAAEVKKQLACDRSYGDSSDAEAEATCTSAAPISRKPVCPPGWTPMMNEEVIAFEGTLFAYRSGCNFAYDIDRHFNTSEHEYMTQFQQQCPGTDTYGDELFNKSADSRSRTFACIFLQETAINCPPGFRPEYRTITFNSAEGEPVTYHRTSCEDNGYRPTIERSPAAAAQERRMRAELKATKTVAERAYAALTESGADLDIECRYSGNYGEMLRDITGNDAIVEDSKRRQESDVPKARPATLIESERVVLTRDDADWGAIWVRLEKDCRKESVGEFVREAVESITNSPKNAYLGGGTLADCGWTEVRAFRLPFVATEFEWIWRLSNVGLDSLERASVEAFLQNYGSTHNVGN